MTHPLTSGSHDSKHACAECGHFKHMIKLIYVENKEIGLQVASLWTFTAIKHFGHFEPN